MNRPANGFVPEKIRIRGNNASSTAISGDMEFGITFLSIIAAEFCHGLPVKSIPSDLCPIL